MARQLLFIVGLTGVGKSTTLAALGEDLRLLPNRRELADRIIIPEMLKDLGREPAPVTDRLERFALTARYRETYPGGVVHALANFLVSDEYAGEDGLVFDNIRGLDECRAAMAAFPGSRFIVLDAPPLVRLRRLVGRDDAFDRVATAAPNAQNTALAARLASVEGLDEVFDPGALLGLEASMTDAEERILKAARIIVTEQQNYDSAAAQHFLMQTVPDATLYLDTSERGLAEVAAAVRGWL